MSQLPLAWVALGLVACGGPEAVEAPRPEISVGLVTSEPAPIASAPPLASASSEPAKPAVPPGPKIQPQRVTFAVKEGSAPCTLVLTGELVAQPDAWFLRDVTRIEAEPCETMQAQLLFDGAQPGVGHDQPLTKIPAIFWIKPGRALSPDAASDFAAFSNGLQDLNADGYRDLCSVEDEMSARSHACWLFDPAKRVFAYHAELSEIPHMAVSNGKLRGWTHARHVHETLEYAWIGGKAELVRRSTELAGADGNGVPTPGRTTLVVEELRGGKVLKKTQRVVPYDPER